MELVHGQYRLGVAAELGDADEAGLVVVAITDEHGGPQGGAVALEFFLSPAEARALAAALRRLADRAGRAPVGGAAD